MLKSLRLYHRKSHSELAQTHMSDISVRLLSASLHFAQAKEPCIVAVMNLFIKREGLGSRDLRSLELNGSCT
jgi:hypothetical protein